MRKNIVICDLCKNITEEQTEQFQLTLKHEKSSMPWEGEICLHCSKDMLKKFRTHTDLFSGPKNKVTRASDFTEQP